MYVCDVLLTLFSFCIKLYYTYEYDRIHKIILLPAIRVK